MCLYQHSKVMAPPSPYDSDTAAQLTYFADIFSLWKIMVISGKAGWQIQHNAPKKGEMGEILFLARDVVYV